MGYSTKTNQEPRASPCEIIFVVFQIFFDDSNFEQKGYQGQTFICVDISVDLLTLARNITLPYYEELKKASPAIKYYFLYNERTNNDRRNETDLCIN